MEKFYTGVRSRTSGVNCGFNLDRIIVNQIQHCHDKISIKQEEESFRQQFGLKFKEDTCKVLHLEQNFMWYCNLDTSESISEIPGKF